LQEWKDFVCGQSSLSFINFVWIVWVIYPLSFWNEESWRIKYSY
jgi:hypothetical protein